MNRLLLTIPDDTATPAAPVVDQGTLVPKAGNGIGESWGTLQTGGPYDLVATPPLTDGGPASIDRFVYDNVALSSSVPFPAPYGGQYSGLAVSECLQTVLVTDRNTKLLYAVPLNGPSPPPTNTSQVAFTDPPTVLYYDEVSQSVLVPFQPANANYHLNAVTLGGTASAPSLTKNLAFTPPADLAVDAVAIRHPNPTTFTCP